MVRDIKSNSKLWIKGNFKALFRFSWQEGYGAFTMANRRFRK